MKIANIAAMGQDNKHLRMRLVWENKYINAVGFGMGEYVSEFNQNDIVDVAFTMEVNNFQGNSQVQLQIKDIKIHE